MWIPLHGKGRELGSIWSRSYRWFLRHLILVKVDMKNTFKHFSLVLSPKNVTDVLRPQTNSGFRCLQNNILRRYPWLLAALPSFHQLLSLNSHLTYVHECLLRPAGSLFLHHHATPPLLAKSLPGSFLLRQEEQGGEEEWAEWLVRFLAYPQHSRILWFFCPSHLISESNWLSFISY